MGFDKQDAEDEDFDLNFHAEASSRVEVRIPGNNNTVLVQPPRAAAWPGVAILVTFMVIIGAMFALWYSGAFGPPGRAGSTVTTPVPPVTASPPSDKGKLPMKRRPSGKTKTRRPISQTTPEASVTTSGPSTAPTIARPSDDRLNTPGASMAEPAS